MDRVLHIRFFSLFILACSALFIWSYTYSAETQNSQYLKVVFFDIGQGDAVFIHTPDGAEVLIDGGRDSSVLHALREELGVSDRTIDMVVATHPDSDHIGGLVDVLMRYDIAHMLITENEGQSNTSEQFFESVSSEGAQVIYARSGQVLHLGASTTLTVLFPEDYPRNMESNASSIITILTYGDTSFMLTGDAPSAVEEYLVSRYGKALRSDVLKVGHHGSHTSSAEVFIDMVDPMYAIVSAGKDSQYGHPHQEVIDRYTERDITILETAKEGNITFYSDGKQVWIE